MGFSQEVKTELEGVLPNGRHCQLAELSAIGFFSSTEPGDNTPAGRKSFTLAKKTSMMNRCVDTALKNSCCKRAFLRGAFLCIGSIVDPNKGYDLEFVCDEEKKALKIQELLADFDINGKISIRKGSYVLYVKEAEMVVNTLNVIGAHNSLMKLENLRVEKDFRNNLNRKVNFETANLRKTGDAAAKQIEDIRRIEENMGLDHLSEPLRQLAVLRLEHPESSLSELGAMMNPPVGKSGVNHRMRRLGDIAGTIQT